MTSSETLHPLQRADVFQVARDRRVRALGVLAVLGVSVGCGDSNRRTSPEAGPSTSTTALPRAPLCPSCRRDAAGNETSDFSGQSPTCTVDPAPMPTDPEVLAGVNQLRQAYAGRHALSMRWSRRDAAVSLESPYYVAAPTGYEEATQVSVDVVLEDTEYFVGRPALAGDPVDCPDGFRVRATLAIATADGALEVEAHGSFTTIPGFVNDLRAHADLADAAGSLDLHLEPERAYRGGVFVDMVALNEGKRGGLQLSVSLDESEEDSAAYVTDYPLEATFPDDGCDVAWGFPVDADAPLPAWNGASAAQLVAEWRAALAPLRAPAVWADCSEADLQFQLGAPTKVCAGTTVDGASRQVRFDAENHLISSDGRLDTIVTRGRITADELSLNTIEPLQQIPPGEFAAAAGVGGVDPGNSPWLTSAVSASFQRDGEEVRTIGSLRVGGLDCSFADCNAYLYRETLDWPRDWEFAPVCE